MIIQVCRGFQNQNTYGRRSHGLTDIVLQTVLEWSSESELHDLRDNIRGIFLFGTPHEGMRTPDLEEMLKDGTGATKLQTLQHQLREGSEYLENQKGALSKVWNDLPFKTVSFYEMAETPTFAKVSPRRLNRSMDDAKSAS